MTPQAQTETYAEGRPSEPARAIIAAANLEDMSFTDLAHTSQSLATVWQIAMMLSQGTITMAARQQ